MNLVSKSTFNTSISSINGIVKGPVPNNKDGYVSFYFYGYNGEIQSAYFCVKCDPKLVTHTPLLLPYFGKQDYVQSAFPMEDYMVFYYTAYNYTSYQNNNYFVAHSLRDNFSEIIEWNSLSQGKSAGYIFNEISINLTRSSKSVYYMDTGYYGPGMNIYVLELEFFFPSKPVALCTHNVTTTFSTVEYTETALMEAVTTQNDPQSIRISVPRATKLSQGLTTILESTITTLDSTITALLGQPKVIESAQFNLKGLTLAIIAGGILFVLFSCCMLYFFVNNRRSKRQSVYNNEIYDLMGSTQMLSDDNTTVNHTSVSNTVVMDNTNFTSVSTQSYGNTVVTSGKSLALPGFLMVMPG
jgi:hypothetical protein